MGFDWKKAVGTLAPALGLALGGPGSAAAGALALVSRALLGHDNGSGDDVAAVLAAGASPDQVERLRAAERDFTLKLVDSAVRLEEVELRDRESAREREAKTGDHWTLRVLAAAIVGGFLGAVFMVLTGRVVGLKDPFVSGTVGGLIGYLSAKSDWVLGYYFGTSASSRAKDAVLGKIAGAK